MKQNLVFTSLVSIYCVLLLLDSLLEIKLINILGLDLTLGTAVIALVYVCSDCLVEVYGYEQAKRVMWLGFGLLAFSSSLLGLSCLIPAIEGWQGNEAFNYIYSLNPRIVVACLTAYLVGTFINNRIMSWLKKFWQGKYFKTRAFLSTVLGESADALIGTFGIFFGLLPLNQIMQIAVSMATVKILIEALVLPITQRVVWYLKTKENQVVIH